jgi:predicted nucleotidyltransferase
MEAKIAALELAGKLKPLETLEAVILFGSASRDETHEKSDINIFLLFNSPNNPETGIESRKVHQLAKIIETKNQLQHPFSFKFMNQDENLDTDLLWEVVKDGMILYARPEILLGRDNYLKPMALISYQYPELSPKEKAHIQRKLYGYQVKKEYKGKKYLNKKEGLVNQFGQKIGRASFLISANKSEDIIELFESKNVNYNLIKTWI